MSNEFGVQPSGCRVLIRITNPKILRNVGKDFLQHLFHRRDAESTENSVFSFLPLRALRLRGEIFWLRLCCSVFICGCIHTFTGAASEVVERPDRVISLREWGPQPTRM